MADEDNPLVFKAEHTFLHDRMMTVVVEGCDLQKEFHIHTGLLRQRSSYFRNLPKDSTTCTLRYTLPEIFELYQEYIYTGRIPCKQLIAHADADYDYQNNRLVSFYLLAARIGDLTAAHAGLAAFLASFREVKSSGMIATPTRSVMGRASTRLTRRSPLYRLLIDMFVWDGRADVDLDGMPNEVAVDVAHAALKQVREGEDGNEAWRFATCCDYHELSDGKKCQTRKRKRDEE